MNKTQWLLLLGTSLVVGCGAEVIEQGGDGGSGDPSHTSTSSGTTSTTSHTTSTSSTTTTSSAIPCPGPEPYSDDCAQIPYFECGFEFSCVDGIVSASWHEHIACDGSEGNEEVYEYSCTHICPGMCDPDYADYPNSGAELVEGYCMDGGFGGSAS